MKLHHSIQIRFVLLLTTVLCWTSVVVQAEQLGWQRQEVDWLAGPGGRIKAIRYPQGETLPFLIKPGNKTSTTTQKGAITNKSASDFRLFSLEPTELQALANIIDSPPIAGFVPRIVIAVTDRRSDDTDWVAETHTSVAGRYLTNSLETDFAIGLFDTGASTHIINYAAANHTGIYDADLVTSSYIELAGATNSAFGKVSQPLGIFIDGLAAIDPNSMMLDDSNMVGQSNVSVIIGDAPAPNEPGLPTVIGSPMSVNFVTAINNDHQISVIYDGNNYTSPDIQFYDHFDSRIPDYANSVPLNLIPTGAADVQYLPDFEAIMDLVFQPGSPSNIGGFIQSLFFVSSVDLHNGLNSAIDKDRFMLDTGAQVTVVGSDVGARLGLNPDNPDFEVDIQDVTGEIAILPGFYIDSLEIPALGEWLRITNVPVVMLDVASPEGGHLDGIIGMNLFVEFNLVLRGGGLLFQDPPSLEFERIQTQLIADIAPEDD
ncbi:MAG: retropepsin-like aspartic protease [Phycisphaerales bacterium]